MEERIKDMEAEIAEAHAYMAALAIAVACICEVTPLDPGKITSRFDALRKGAPPAIAARAGEILAALLPPQPAGRDRPSASS